MEFDVRTNLPLVFLAAGFTLWVTSLALARRARRYQASMQALLELASAHWEPLELPAAAWPALHSAGWSGLQWSGDWYGQAVQGALGGPVAAPGALTAAQQNYELRSGEEVRLFITLQHSAPGGEQRLFANQLAQVFLLLLETRLRERTGALSAAMAERARLSLYLQHDMRNLAQWVMWVSADFANAHTPPDLLVAAERLRDNAPMAQTRALRLITALGKTTQPTQASPIALGEALQQAASLAGIEMDIAGEAMAIIAPDLLARALDNLLTNLAADWREGLTQRPHATLHMDADMAEIVLSCPLPPGGIALLPERLFEPFASGRPGGLGLGLYQARKSLREAKGELHAAVNQDQLQFVLSMPAAPHVPQGAYAAR
jgi:signal transduction histidine kinase